MQVALNGRPDASAATSPRDAHWEHCRNGLAIARLLVHERRPLTFVETACLTAVEMACRSGLEQTRTTYDGNLERALLSLAVPADMAVWPAVASPTEALAHAERVVGWLAGRLRAEVPERAWGY